MASFYTLLYVAPVSEAESIALDVDEDAKDRFPSAWLQYVGDEELVALWDLVDAAGNEGTLMADLVYDSPDGEVMVMTVPRSFVAALAAAEPEPIAQQWQATELMQQWSAADVLTVVRELTALCKRSVERGEPVLQVSRM